MLPLSLFGASKLNCKREQGKGTLIPMVTAAKNTRDKAATARAQMSRFIDSVIETIEKTPQRDEPQDRPTRSATQPAERLRSA